MPNNKLAKKVLKLVQAKLEDEDGHVDVQSYVNCKEQGFAVTRFDKLDVRVAFSESHNCGSLVVYSGLCGEFESNTNIPSKQVYEDRTLFGPDSLETAATYIIQRMKHGPKRKTKLKAYTMPA
jgi:hypothetical protein